MKSNCHRNIRFLPKSKHVSWCREGESNPHEVALGGF
jgi:hypothetical protein